MRPATPITLLYWPALLTTCPRPSRGGLPQQDTFRLRRRRSQAHRQQPDLVVQHVKQGPPHLEKPNVVRRPGGSFDTRIYIYLTQHTTSLCYTKTLAQVIVQAIAQFCTQMILMGLNCAGYADSSYPLICDCTAD